VRQAPAPSQDLTPPRIIAQGGRRGWIAALGGGVLFGAATLIIPAPLPTGDALGFLAILLGEIGAVYLGFVLADGRTREFRIEYAGIVLFTVLAAAGLGLSAPVMIAAGYLAHGIWGILHGPRGIHTRVPGGPRRCALASTSSWAPVCLSGSRNSANRKSKEVLIMHQHAQPVSGQKDALISARPEGR
jgi:hypothetical protein